MGRTMENVGLGPRAARDLPRDWKCVWQPWGQKGRWRTACEGSALLWRWDLGVKAVEAFKQEDDIIRCVF